MKSRLENGSPAWVSLKQQSLLSARLGYAGVGVFVALPGSVCSPLLAAGWVDGAAAPASPGHR